METLFETERLIVRPYTLDDVDEGFPIWSDPLVMLHIGTGEPMREPEEARRWLEWAVSYQQKHGFCRWAVVEKESRRLVGSCGLLHLYGGEEIDLGYLFARDCWGRGYATEAGRACLQYGFEKLELPVIVAAVEQEHHVSRRVLEKIGMVYAGIKRFDDTDDAYYVARAPKKIKPQVNADRRG